MTATDDSAGRQGPAPGYARPHGGTGYDAYGRPVHPGWAGAPSPYERPRPQRVPLPQAPVWLPIALVGVGVVAAFLATLNRPGLGLVITGVVAGLTALAALMVRPAIPESGVPPEEAKEDVTPSPDAPRGRAVAEAGTNPRVHATVTPEPAVDAGPGTPDVPEEAVGTPDAAGEEGPDESGDEKPDEDARTGDAAASEDYAGPDAEDGAHEAPPTAEGGASGGETDGTETRDADSPVPEADTDPKDTEAPQGYPGHPGYAAAPWPRPGYADRSHPGYPGHAYPWHHGNAHVHQAYAAHGHRPPYEPPPAAPPRPDRYAYTWSAVFGVLAAVLLATAALRDAGWVLVWTLTGSFLLASMAFATRNPAARRNAVGVATGALALLRNLPATPRFLLSPLNTKRAAGLVLPLIVTSMVTLGLLLVFGLLFALADPVFSAYIGRMFTSVGTGSGLLRLFGMLVTMLLTGAAVLTARRYHRPRPRPAAPAADPLWPVWVWTVPLAALVALFVAFVGVQAAVMFGGDDYVQRVSGVIYAEYARQGFFQLVVVSALVLGVIAVAVRLLPSRIASTRTLRNALLGLLCVLTLVILASAMMRLQLYIDTFGLTRLRVSAEAWILWSAGVFGLVIVAGLCNTLGRSAAWLPRVTVAFGAVALAVFAYGNPDLRIAESHHDLDLAAVDTWYLRDLSADAVPGLMGLPEHERDCALVGLRDRLDDPDGRGVAAWNLSRVQGRQQLAELGLFNDVSGLDCGVRDYVDW
ncbi:DUF4153 domain-containing protein [Nocardiopsis aegyptia]|uniref:DUF4173 domain-containing protein n=1 Tax=Nocardiopsis aegyptia TaxID=220378 RepID=A0A7Z0EKT4_9ACTN|nr:DUF4153 domain-containing protein [Nocardiopsis aegyptia]NYJ33836.1 hypothetical protein [Nocardiopsis aegyptia]